MVDEDNINEEKEEEPEDEEIELEFREGGEEEPEEDEQEAPPVIEEGAMETQLIEKADLEKKAAEKYEKEEEASRSTKPTEEMESAEDDTLEMERDHSYHDKAPEPDSAGVVDLDFSEDDKTEIDKILKEPAPPFVEGEHRTEELAEMDFGEDDKKGDEIVEMDSKPGADKEEVELTFAGDDKTGDKSKEPPGDEEVELDFAEPAAKKPAKPAPEEKAEHKVKKTSFDDMFHEPSAEAAPPPPKTAPPAEPEGEVAERKPAWAAPDKEKKEDFTPGEKMFEVRSADDAAAAGISGGITDLNQIPLPPPPPPGYTAPFEKSKPVTSFTIPGIEDLKKGSFFGGVLKFFLLILLLAVLAAAAARQFYPVEYNKYALKINAKLKEIIGVELIPRARTETGVASATGTSTALTTGTGSGTASTSGTGTASSTSTGTSTAYSTGTGTSTGIETAIPTVQTAPRPPRIAIKTGPPEVTDEKTVKFTFEGIDVDGTILGYLIGLNKLPPTQWTISTEWTSGELTPGDYTFYAMARDNDGNSSKIASWRFKIVDKLKPLEEGTRRLNIGRMTFLIPADSEADVKEYLESVRQSTMYISTLRKKDK